MADQGTEVVRNIATRAVPTAATDKEASMPEGAAGEEIAEKLRAIFNGLVELKVVTIVQDIGLDVSTGHGRTTASLKPFGEQVPALVTIFNMIDGDVINVVPPSLAGDAALRGFHTAQVEKSLAVLPANIEALVTFGKAIIKELS